jgi:hypothetical protein
MNRLAPDVALTSPTGPLADRRMLYVIGAQRSGTTWLHSQFVGHPELHIPGQKETHYWDTIRPPYHQRFRELARQELEDHTRSGWRDHYRQHGLRALARTPRAGRRLRARHEAFNDPGSGHTRYGAFMTLRSRRGQVIVDNTPAYSLLDRATFAEMAGICGDAKFVFILRDPVTRLWSGLGLHVRQSSPGDLDRDLKLALDRALGPDTARDYARSNYARTIQELEQAVSLENIHYIFFEELFTKATIDALYDFVRVARAEVKSDRAVNASRRGGKLDPESRARCRERLAPVYEFIAERFGDRVPEAWRRQVAP